MSPGRAQRATGRKIRNRYGCAVLVGAVALIAAFSGALELFWTRVDQRRFPWAYVETGRPTLTGTSAQMRGTAGTLPRGPDAAPRRRCSV